MVSVYYIKINNDKNLCFYYEKDIGIVYRSYENNSWSDKKIVFKNSSKYFTLTILNKNIYIFCKDLMGNLYATNNVKGVFRSKVLIDNDNTKAEDTSFYPVITNELITFIYNASSVYKDKTNLAIQSINSENNWSNKINIDTITPMKNQIFSFFRIDNYRYIVFYIKNDNNYNLGYRIITNNIVGGFQSLYQTTHKIIDESFIYFNDAVHCVFVIVSLFSYKLIYTKKESNMPLEHVTLYESDKIDNCIISIVNNVIVIHFISNNKVSKIILENEKVILNEELDYKDAYNLRKSNFIFITNENKFITKEVYVQKDKPWEVEIYHELIEKFIPEYSKYEKVIYEYEKKIKLKDKEILNQNRRIRRDEKNIYELTKVLESKNEVINNLSNENYKYNKIINKYKL